MAECFPQAGNLVFEGTGNGQFELSARTQEKKSGLHRRKAGSTAGPISYTANGEQYIAILVGWAASASCSRRSRPTISADEQRATDAGVSSWEEGPACAGARGEAPDLDASTCHR